MKGIQELMDRGVIHSGTVVMDATFIQLTASGIPMTTPGDTPDPQARVGGSGKKFDLGYKAHMTADSESELPVAFIVAPASDNQKRQAYQLLDKTLEATQERAKTLVADSQYSSKRFTDKADCGCRL